MLTTARKIKGFKLRGVDGEVGSIKEFFFDDNFWTIRYLVANTGGLFNRNQVLISPYFLQRVNEGSKLIDVNLTKAEIENSPSIDENLPISRQYEESYYNYFGAPVYWGGPLMWGYSSTIDRDRDKWKSETRKEKAWNSNLQSSKDVSGHTIQAKNGEIGHVDDFIIDDDSWAIRYLVIDTRSFLPGKKVLISPKWIDRIDWHDKNVLVDLTRESIKQSPEYDEEELLTRDYENKLHGYYHRKGYWIEDSSLNQNYSGKQFRQGRV